MFLTRSIKTCRILAVNCRTARTGRCPRRPALCYRVAGHACQDGAHQRARSNDPRSPRRFDRVIESLVLLAMPHTRQVPALKECATLRGWLGRSSAGPWTDSTRWRGRSAASRRQFGLGFNRHLLSKLATGRARSHVTATPMRSTTTMTCRPKQRLSRPLKTHSHLGNASHP